jgi:hypothetical protein
MLDDQLEAVAIETVHVGDYVVVDPPARPAGARCVIAKHPKGNARTERIAGWLVELVDGKVAWWPRGATVWRRRIA